MSSRTLKDNKTRLLVAELHNKNFTNKQISTKVNIPLSTISDFLLRKTYVQWWLDYDEKESSGIEQQVITSPLIKDITNKLITEFKYPIVTTKKEVPDDCKHMFIPDTQCKPGVDMSYLTWIGKYIVDRKPEVIIHIGDHADMPSLSSYDKGRRAAEGRRVVHDINAAIEGMERLLKPLYDYQQKELAEHGKVLYTPRMVFTIGNHEERIQRHVDANPELYGFLGYDALLYDQMGWEVYDFLKPVIVNGVTYCHFMANPYTGKPYGGMAMNILRHVGESFSMGHKQTLDIATRFLPASGKQQWAIVAGAAYTHEEDYKGHQGNHHWRGLIVKHNVSNGSYNPMFVDLKYLERKYGE